MDVEIIEAGDISFFRKVSCEDAGGDNHDYLAFYIDDTEQGRWDGEQDWEQLSYNITEGYHRLRWTYIKNNSLSAGLDAAFIDNISFPDFLDMDPQLLCTPMEWEKIMRPDEQDIDTLIISNPNQGELEFEIEIIEITDNSNGGSENLERADRNISWLSCDLCSGSISAQGEEHIMLTFNTDGLGDGDHYCELIISDNFQHETIIPVHLLVDTYLGNEFHTRDEIDLHIYPNPGSGLIHLRYSIFDTRYSKLELFSIEGVLVKSILDKTIQAGEYINKLDISDLPAGVYFLKFQSGDMQIVRKLIHKP
jgi:hypothetical protein